jgi:hypothetical protein
MDHRLAVVSVDDHTRTIIRPRRLLVRFTPPFSKCTQHMVDNFKHTDKTEAHAEA